MAGHLEERMTAAEQQLKQQDAAIKAMQEWRSTIAEAVEVQREMVDVGKDLIKALGWASVAAKWILTIGAAATVVWQAVKFAWRNLT